MLTIDAHDGVYEIVFFFLFWFYVDLRKKVGLSLSLRSGSKVFHQLH